MIIQNKELHKYLQNLLGERFEAFINARPEPTGIRTNTLVADADQVEDLLKRHSLNYRKLPFNKNGFALDQDLPLSHTLDFFSGRFQYQGLSSQIPALVLNPGPGQRVLDMAAAPGSKSTQIAALMENGGQLFVNDIARQRLQPLNANLQKAGVINSVILNLAAERLGNLMPNYFDKVLLDAPCTALGTMSGHPEILSWWSLDRLERLTALQQRLLISAFKAAKVGAEIVYSTCSVSPQENEAQIEQLCRDYPVELLAVQRIEGLTFDSGFGGYDTQLLQHVLRIWPDRHGMEGFFVALLRKTGSQAHIPGHKKMPVRETLSSDSQAVAGDLKEISGTWGIPEDIWSAFRFVRGKDRIWLLNDAAETVPAEGLSNAGLLLAEKKQRMWKLFNQSARFLGRSVSKRRIELDDTTLKDLFAGGRPCPVGIAPGYHALERRGEVIGVVYAENGRLRIRLPHKFRLYL